MPLNAVYSACGLLHSIYKALLTPVKVTIVLALTFEEALLGVLQPHGEVLPTGVKHNVKNHLILQTHFFEV